MGRTPSFCEVFARTHTRKKDRELSRAHPPPAIDEEAIWLRIAGGRKKGRIYGKGVVPAYSILLIIGGVDNTDTTSGPPDVREQKVQTLEIALESQSQEVSQVRKAYSDMYSFLELMRSGGSGLTAFTAMPPPSPLPPPPPARSLSPSP
ncbi:hypothetical protein PIB30_041205 [Stylosanthes scabra]|uniref:Uncharacterized protein n=1 Tax=Stylosanthes scabra TaxID=79078 RepID=A0ABU6ZDJ9_9FABA|nr:hypothetical protein [Stylosanthes scabra]